MLQTSPEQAQNVIRRQETFITTLDANDEKINEVINLAKKLISENNYAADKLQLKADTLQDR